MFRMYVQRTVCTYVCTPRTVMNNVRNHQVKSSLFVYIIKQSIYHCWPGRLSSRLSGCRHRVFAFIICGTKLSLEYFTGAGERLQRSSQIR